MESESLIRLEDRIRSGEVTDNGICAAMLELTGSEEMASAAFTERCRARIKAGQRVDV